MWQVINNFIGNILHIIGMFLVSKICLNKKIQITKIKYLIEILICSSLYTVIMIYFKGTIKTSLMMLTLFLFNKDVFKEKNLKTIFITVLYTLTLLGLDLFVLFFTVEILNISKEICYNVIAGSIGCNLVVQTLTVIAIYISRNLLRKIINAEISNNKKIIIYFILTFLSIALFFYIFAKEFRINGNSLPYLISIFVFITIFISLIKQTMANNKLTLEYDNLLAFMTTYENEIENQRILRHEIKNEFRTIRAKINDKQRNQEIIEYIDEILKEKYEVNQEKYAKFGYLPANGIKGLFYFKTQEAENKGIKVSLNISKKTATSNMYNLNIKEQRDFGRMMGVFLDNAIEASIEAKDKQIGIEVYINKETECKIIITNTYENKLDKNKIGKENYSTKGRTRGHGLLLVKQIVSKNEKFKIETEIRKNIYIQKIEIKNIN